MLSSDVKRRLPKAKLVSFRWSPAYRSMWTKFRLANAHQFHIGRLVVIVRAPWLERSARQLHPELFNS